MNSFALAVVSYLVVASAASPLVAQALPVVPPARPRLLISQSEIPALQARINRGGEPTAAWNQMATSAVWWCGTNSGSCPGGVQAHWRVERALRSAMELGLRYAVTGDLAAGQNARQMLVAGGANSAVGYIRPQGLPTGSFKPFREGAIVGAIAIIYDLVHPLLTATERAQVVAHLEGWIDSMRGQSNAVASYSTFSGATDNYVFGWNTGIGLALMAIWGDSSRPNIPQQIDQVLQFIRSGYMDPFSPDGSYDESHGYVNYGGLYSVRAALAGRRCGFTDILANTNVLKAPRWYLSLTNDTTFELHGDTQDGHRDLNWDPILYALVQESGDAEAFYGLEQLQTWRPVGLESDSMSFSPWVTKFLHYPDHLTPRAPRVRSAFFRDNENIAPNGTANWNRTNNHPAIGLGGMAYLRDDSGFESRFGIDYVIKDEWRGHGHEDDGHIGLMVSERNFLIDLGTSSSRSPAFFSAQSLQHNIVSSSGAHFLGATSNYYSPPPPLGRFHGVRMASSFGVAADYVRGDHRNMWMMDEANRSVALLKDETLALTIIHDRVRKGSGNANYEQRWHTPAPMGGSGTVPSPYTINSGVRRIFGTMLAPGAYNRSTAGPLTNPTTGLVYYRNEITSAGTGPVDYLLVWTAVAPTASTALVNPSGGVRGSTLSFPGSRTVEILAGPGTTIGDIDTSTDARMACIRRTGTQLEGYLLAEGTVLDDRGLRLVDASEPVTVSAKSGAIDVSRALSLQGTPFSGRIVCYAPFMVSEVYVDGVSVPFTSVGTTVAIGVAPQRPLPNGLPPYTLDRFYTFDPAIALDGVLGGEAFRTTDGRLASRTGAPARFRPLTGNTAYNAGALAIAFEVEARASMGGLLSTVFVEDVAGQVQYQLEIWDHPGVGKVIHGFGPRISTPFFSTVPALPNEIAVRLHFLLDLADGRLEVRDRLGNLAITQTLDAITVPVVPVLEIYGDARVDDYAVLDDAEVAGHPQGVVANVDGLGRLSIYANAEDVLGLQDLEIVVGSTRLDFPAVLNILTAFGYREELVLPFVTGPLATAPREFCLQPTVQAANSLPGERHIIDMITRGNDRLVEGVVP